MKKRFISIVVMFAFFFTLSGCVDSEDNSMRDSEIFKVIVLCENEISYGSPFVIRVESTNISGRNIRKKTYSSLYKIGATIEVYTILEGEKYVLHDEFETLTDDECTEEIKNGETLLHEWKFDSTLNSFLHGTMLTEGVPQRLFAPKGVYNIFVSTGELIENAFAII